MDGIIEQKSVLVHSKISDAGKRNGLINTRNFMGGSGDGDVCAESKAARMSLPHGAQMY